MKLTKVLVDKLNQMLRDSHEVFINGKEIEGIGTVDGMFDESRYFEVYGLHADYFQYAEGTEVEVLVLKVEREIVNVDA